MAWIKFTALGTIAALAFTAATARADDAADWAKARKTHYAAYRAQQNLAMLNLADTLPRPRPDTIAF